MSLFYPEGTLCRISSCHGSNIALDDEKISANRIHGYGNALIFSEEALKSGDVFEVIHIYIYVVMSFVFCISIIHMCKPLLKLHLLTIPQAAYKKECDRTKCKFDIARI